MLYATGASPSMRESRINRKGVWTIKGKVARRAGWGVLGQFEFKRRLRTENAGALARIEREARTLFLPRYALPSLRARVPALRENK